MADIMIDNWTLQRAAISINDTYEKISSPNEEYVKLIEALVLWDHVYFIDNEYSQYWKKFLYRFGYEKYLSPFAIPKEENISVHSLGDIENSIISEKALMYSTFCNKHNISYLPCKERAEYLQQCNLISPCNRKDVMDYFDKSLKEYYESLNHRLGKSKIKFSQPVLFDFIAANTASDKSLIQTALQIISEREVAEFRSWLTTFEQEIQYGNWQELEKLLVYLPALISDITKVIPATREFEIQIGLSPAIGISVPFGKSASKLFHVNFLKTLSSFAIQGRSMT